MLGKMRVNIEPKEQTIRKMLSALDITVERVRLNVSASIHVKIFDDAGELADYQTLLLSGEEYNQWASDDQYIVNFVCEQLGFVLANAPQEVPEE
jgi:hypothetical protein